MIGAYMAFALQPIVAQYLGGGLLATIALCVVMAAVLGYFLEGPFFSFLYRRDHLQQVLMTYCLILVFEELRSLMVDIDVHGVPVPVWLNGSIDRGAVIHNPGIRDF